MSKKRKTKKQKVRATQRKNESASETVSLQDIGVKTSRSKRPSKKTSAQTSAAGVHPKYRTERLAINYPYILKDAKMSLVVSGVIFASFVILSFVL